jgi:DnaJ-domain-containing protein 1
LKLKESEIEKERRLREELNQRLAALQSKLVGHHDESTGGQALEESSDLAARREAAERSLRERRLRAKKKREEREARQQAELERVLNEKQAMEEELEELRNSAAASAGMTELQENMVEKKLNKLKKKYEKKIKTLMSELDDVHEVR